MLYVGCILAICLLSLSSVSGLDYCTKLGLKCVPYGNCPPRADGKPNYYPHVYGYCSDYRLYCCKSGAPRPITTTARPGIVITRKPTVVRPGTGGAQCGISSGGGWRIISGSPSASGQWPWQVSLSFRTQHMCGGTLIDDRTIVTAAHCFDFPGGTYAAYWDAVVGEITRNSRAKRYRIARISRHTGFRKFRGNDIAIMTLSERVPFDSTKSPACLPETIQDPEPGTVCYVTGFGQTNSYNGPPSYKLLHVDVKVITQSTCTRAYGSRSISSGTICAGGHTSKNACKGDSGGPLVCQKNGRWYLHGIVSFGSDPCGQRGSPGVYTRVTSYLNWIKARM